MPEKMKVESPNGQAAGRDIQVHAAAPENFVHAINGGTNFIGNQGPVHVVIGRTRTPAPATPLGPEHLNEEQKCKLKEMLHEWVTLHTSIKKAPLSYAAAWLRVNRHAKVSSYHYILQDDFEKVCAFVRKQMSMLRNMASAPAKDKTWRSKRIQAIKVRCKMQLGGDDAYLKYISKNFGLHSLAELSTDQLQKTYAYIMAKKSSA